MARLLNLGDNLTSEDVYKLAMGGNQNAKRVFEYMGRALGIGLANFVADLQLSAVSIERRGVGGLGSFRAGHVRRGRAGARSPSATTDAQVEKATLGSDAGLYGAAYLPFLSNLR